MEIGLCRFEQFMAKPQRDHGAIDAGLQQLHRSAVPQHVWRRPASDFNEGHRSHAARTIFRQRLDAVTRRLLHARRAGSFSMAWITVRAYAASGVNRSFRPRLCEKSLFFGRRDRELGRSV